MLKHCILLLFVVFLLSCGSNSSPVGAPGTFTGKGNQQISDLQVRQLCSLLERALNYRDLNLIRTEFTDFITITTSARDHFKCTGNRNAAALNFFDQYFIDNSNINVTINPKSIQIMGETATVQVDITHNATYIRDIPPSNYYSRTVDLWVVSLIDGQAKVVSWSVKEDTVL